MDFITLMMMLDSDSENDAIEELLELERISLLCRAAAIELEGESSGDDASSKEDHSHHPQVKWTQRLNKVCIKVQLAGAKDINVKLEPEGMLSFSATTCPNGNSYELILKLHDKINVEESKITKGVGNVLCLLVKAKQGLWKKLFSGDTPHCIEVDWDRWVDEGDSNFGNTGILDLFSKSQPSDKSKKENNRKMNVGALLKFPKRKSQKTCAELKFQKRKSQKTCAEQKFRKRKSQKTSLKPISACKDVVHSLAVPHSHPMLPPACSSFDQGESSTGAVPHKNFIKSPLTQVGGVLESKNCSGHSSLPADNLLQQHFVKTSLDAASTVQLAQAIKAERDGLYCEIKAKNYELVQLRKEIQEQKAQLEEKAALLEVEKFNIQRSYKQERFEHLKKFEKEKAELHEKFKQEMTETKTKYEAVANDIFYQVWRNNQEGNFGFLGREVEKVIAGFKQRFSEEITFSNDAS